MKKKPLTLYRRATKAANERVDWRRVSCGSGPTGDDFADLWLAGYKACQGDRARELSKHMRSRK